MAKETSKTELNDLVNDSKLPGFEIEAYKKQHKVYIVMWYYRIQNLYFRSIGNNELAHQNAAALVSYFESDKKLLKNFESEYINALCGYTRTSFHLNKIKELETSIVKVQQLYKTKKNFKTLEATCDMGILCYLRTYEYKKAKRISELMDTLWTELALKVEDGKLLWYAHTNIILHWLCANTIALTTWINRGLAIARSNKGRAFYFGIRMFALITDLDNRQLFAFKEKLEALQKTLQNNEHLTNFEKIVLEHFRTFYNIEVSNKTIHLKPIEKKDLILQNFQSLKKNLLKLEFKNPPINYGEVMLWCESHLQNKTIKAVFETDK